MHKTPLEHQDIWLQKSCADKTTPLRQTILQQELWHMSACTEEGLMLESQEKKLEITFSQNKSKLRREKCQEVGPLKLLTLLTK